METKPLLYGLIGFFLGGFIVSIASTTLDKPVAEDKPTDKSAIMDTISMSEMVASLENKTGDDYDEAFINEMIAHHQSAVDMAKLSSANAKHDEIKELSDEIINAQEKEITKMKQWQMDWGYSSSPEHDSSEH